MRTLRIDGRVVVTPLAGGPVDLPPKAARLAARAAAEHASIASYTRASLELIALGAPADLLEATHRAALDEVEHARQCYALASKLAGRELQPGSVPQAPLTPPTFASAAVATLHDACISESTSAARAREWMESEADPEIAATLAHIAADEDRHAQLAHETLAWLVSAGERMAVDALREAIACLPADRVPSNITSLLAQYQSRLE